MKKNLTIVLLAMALIQTLITFTVRASVADDDLSEFSAAQQSQLTNWWTSRWVTYFGSNMSEQATPETGVLRDGVGEIKVQRIMVKGEGNQFVLITPDGITCYDASRNVVCQVPSP
jgi:hypothetical protein